jgi:hypothetical protein
MHAVKVGLALLLPTVIASAAKQSSLSAEEFWIASSLLAMTVETDGSHGELPLAFSRE